MCMAPRNLEETLSIFGEKEQLCKNGQIETWIFEDKKDYDRRIRLNSTLKVYSNFTEILLIQ